MRGDSHVHRLLCDPVIADRRRHRDLPARGHRRPRPRSRPACRAWSPPHPPRLWAKSHGSTGGAGTLRWHGVQTWTSSRFPCRCWCAGCRASRRRGTTRSQCLSSGVGRRDSSARRGACDPTPPRSRQERSPRSPSAPSWSGYRATPSGNAAPARGKAFSWSRWFEHRPYAGITPFPSQKSNKELRVSTVASAEYRRAGGAAGSCRGRWSCCSLR